MAPAGHANAGSGHQLRPAPFHFKAPQKMRAHFIHQQHDFRGFMHGRRSLLHRAIQFENDAGFFSGNIESGFGQLVAQTNHTGRLHKEGRAGG